MEKKQKDLISILLLVVGVVFILVAGSIFVTTAWQYLPLFAKQLALLVVALGLFGCSYRLSKNEKLGWISETLFHLANAFVGFFVIAIMGGLLGTDAIGSFKIFLASGVMASLVGMKMIVKKTAFDVAALALLVDTLLISGCIAFETTFALYMYLLAGFVLALAVIDALCQKRSLQHGFEICVGIVYLLHICVYALFAVCGSMALVTRYTDIKSVLDGILWLGTIVGATTISWVARKHEVIRILNSAILVWFTFVTVNGSFQIMIGEPDFGSVMVMTVFAVSVLMVWLRRVELTGLMIAAAVVIPYGQLFFYWFDALISLFDGVDAAWTTTYNPYSIIIGVAMFALYIVKYGCSDIVTNWKEGKLLKFAALQGATGCVMWIASKMTDSWGMVFFALATIDMLLVVTLFKNETAKRVFGSFAMSTCILAIGCQPFVAIPSAFCVEWNCLLVALGIVLFRHIWYDKKDQFSILYFITTCVLLAVLLLNNLNDGGIGNVLILGMVGIVMLIVAALHNNKKYVVASSVTLMILVLYLTREFWLSIAWWVYLFAAGVLLVLMAIKKAKEL